MTRSMSPEDARAFAARWALVAEEQREELQGASLEQKFTQLAAMMESARALSWATTDPGEVDLVRGRWNRLAAIYARG